MTVFWVALAGGLGTAARYGVGVLAGRWFGGNFPWGTLTVNVLGAFAIGLVFTAGISREVALKTQVIIATGFLGGFTTYSAFAYDSLMMLERRGAGVFALYIGATLAIGITGCWLGIKVGRLF